MAAVQRVVAMANGSAALRASFVAVGFDNPQSVLTSAIATYADDATERVMESMSAAAVVTAQETVRGTETSVHMTVSVTMGNAVNH